MGYRQSVVVLKEGDWVLIQGTRVGRITANYQDHIFVEGERGYFLPYQVTKIDPALNQILSDSISKGERDESI